MEAGRGLAYREETPGRITDGAEVAEGSRGEGEQTAADDPRVGVPPWRRASATRAAVSAGRRGGHARKKETANAGDGTGRGGPAGWWPRPVGGHGLGWWNPGEEEGSEERTLRASGALLYSYTASPEWNHVDFLDLTEEGAGSVRRWPGPLWSYRRPSFGVWTFVAILANPQYNTMKKIVTFLVCH